MKELKESDPIVGPFRRRPQLEELVPLVGAHEFVLKGEPWLDYMHSPWVWQLTSSTEALNKAQSKQAEEDALKAMVKEIAAEFRVDFGQLKGAIETSSRNLGLAVAEAWDRGLRQSRPQADASNQSLTLIMFRLPALGLDPWVFREI